MRNTEELANYFVHNITKSTIGVEARVNSAMQAIPKLKERGWSLNEIKIELDQFANEYPQVVVNIYHIDEIMGKKEPPNNLMEQDVFYYHNLLRNTSSPTKIVVDEDTGRLVRKSEPFFLEMKKRFTMKDLMDYWYDQMNITPNDHMKRQDEGKFNYILGNYNIDEVLFAIDASKTIRSEMHVRLLRNAFELDRYMDDAREFIKAKENTHKMQGINREFKRSN